MSLVEENNELSQKNVGLTGESKQLAREIKKLQVDNE